MFYLGSAEAEALMRTGALPRSAKLAVVDGDHGVFERFSQRYLTRVSLLGLQSQRIQAMAGPSNARASGRARSSGFSHATKRCT